MTRIPGIERPTLAMLALLGYGVTTAISATWVTFSFQHVNPAAMTFVTFAIAQACYLVHSRRRLPSVLRFALANRRETAKLNVLTMTSWLAMFAALQHIEASVESAVFQGTVAVGGVLLATLYGTRGHSRTTWLGIAAIAGTLGLAGVVRVTTGSSQGTPLHNASAALGLGLAFVAGALGAGYIFSSSVLHRRTGASVGDVLCIRFALLLVVTGCFGLPDVVKLVTSGPMVLVKLAVLSVSFVVLPTVLLQWAIAELPSVRVSIMTPLVPVFALVPEYVLHPWASPVEPALVVAASVFIVLTNLALTRETRRAAARPTPSPYQLGGLKNPGLKEKHG